MNHPFFTQDLAEQGLRYKPLVEGEAGSRSRSPSGSQPASATG